MNTEVPLFAGVHKTIYCRSWRNQPIRVLDGMRQWGHCAGILDGDEWVIEATLWHGVTATPLADVIRRSSEHHVIERAVDDKKAGDAWALGTIGASYDWTGAFGVRWNRSWQCDDRWFCSEHDAMWQLMCGRAVWRPGTRGVSPNDSYAVL